VPVVAVVVELAQAQEALPSLHAFRASELVASKADAQGEVSDGVNTCAEDTCGADNGHRTEHHAEHHAVDNRANKEPLLQEALEAWNCDGLAVPGEDPDDGDPGILESSRRHPSGLR
jgi:hypothetical protein